MPAPGALLLEVRPNVEILKSDSLTEAVYGT